MAKMNKMAFWMHEMIKRVLDISPQASVLKTLSFLELPFQRLQLIFYNSPNLICVNLKIMMSYDIA